MKKYISLFLAAGALALTGCVEESLPKEDGNEITIQAVMAENPGTRTMIQDGTTSVLWEPGDEVKLFYKTTGSRFTSNNTEPSGTADFTGNLTITGFFGEGFTADTPLWAVYPYRADATSDGESVTTTLPAEQTGRAGSFAKSTNITLAKSSNTKMGFYNVCGGVRFSLTQPGVKEVVFQGQNEENIAGKVKLAFVDGVPAIQEVTEGQKTITLTAPGGGTFETGKWYYIVALPGTLSNGFKMTFNTETQYATLKSSGSKTIKRGIFGSLADADEDLIYKDKGDVPNPDDMIQFEDLAAKYACVEKFDTDGDGEVSYAEAAAVTSLANLFEDWGTVKTFEEIRHFTSVTTTQGVFDRLANLKHITIPENITTLGSFQYCVSLEKVILPAAITSLPKSCFEGCTALNNVTLPTGITELPDNCFRSCSALTSVDIPSELSSVGNCAFLDCIALTSIDLPSGVKRIGESSFQNCRALLSIAFPAELSTIGKNAFCDCLGLTSVDLPEGVSIGESAFSGCESMSNVVLPSNMTVLPNHCFESCYNLSTITWPEALTTVGEYAFWGCTFADKNYTIELPNTVKTIYRKAFSFVRHIKIPTQSVVTIYDESFINNWTCLYVPLEQVEMYKLRTIWSDYASQIRALSEYPSSITMPIGEPVDLGLSVKWATCNVGTKDPEEGGFHFAWGETMPKSDDERAYHNRSNYIWGTYKFELGSGMNGPFSKYVLNSSFGDVDNKARLDFEDDAARVNWGGSWRIPTIEEWRELHNNCTWVWTKENGWGGWGGYWVTSNKEGYTDKSIFIPTTGYHNEEGSWWGSGHYWSATLLNSNNGNGVCVWSSKIEWKSYSRCYGLAIRPVCD